MTTQIALLRAVNVGGHGQVTMADLRQLLVDVGMKKPRSLLQTGNLVFESRAADDAELERTLEVETERRLGLRTDFLVRGAQEWSSMITRNPFPEAAASDPSHLLVILLKSQPAEDSVRALDARPGPERVGVWGRHLFATYPEGIGRSKLTIGSIERQLGTRGTARNWNTVLKLAALASG